MRQYFITNRYGNKQTIDDSLKTGQFKAELFAHQQEKTDYLAFIGMCTAKKIEKWEVDIEKLTDTYFECGHDPYRLVLR